MKKNIINFLKYIILTTIWILISFVTLVSLALNFPSSVPWWETIWWVYMEYFNKIFQDCWNWYFIQGYDSSKNKICVPAI